MEIENKIDILLEAVQGNTMLMRVITYRMNKRVREYTWYLQGKDGKVLKHETPHGYSSSVTKEYPNEAAAQEDMDAMVAHAKKTGPRSVITYKVEDKRKA